MVPTSKTDWMQLERLTTFCQLKFTIINWYQIAELGINKGSMLMDSLPL